MKPSASKKVVLAALAGNSAIAGIRGPVNKGTALVNKGTG